MQGQPQVIEYLKELLRGELAARDQYFLHSRMYADWGFTKLYERINHEMQEETEHADALLKRILFLEGTPDMIGEFVDVEITQVYSNSLRGNVILREKDMGLRVAVSPQSILAKQPHADDNGVTQFVPA